MMGIPSMDTPPLLHSLLPSFSPTETSSHPLHELSTIHSSHNLAEAFFCSTPFPPLDPPAPSMSTSIPPNSRKRRAIVDEFSLPSDAWKLNEEISFNVHSLSQLINADNPLFNDNYAPNTPLINASYNCNDLEDVLNFLWMEDDTASTAQSAASPHASSADQISLISEFDLDYGSHESSSNQGELGDDPSSDNFYSLGMKQAEQGRPSSKPDDHCLHIRASWQQKDSRSEVRASWQQQKIQTTRATWQEATRASWQQKQEGSRASWHQKLQGRFEQQKQASRQDETRASWLDETMASWQDETRASWQPKEGGIRDSWQQKQEAGTRASWQPPAASCKEERVTSAMGAVSSSGKPTSWAGPTLLEIESALAFTGLPYTSPPPTPSSNTKHADNPSFFDLKKLLSTASTGEPPEQDSLNSSWRMKLQKRNSQEPKYTVKVESEEKAVGDGYRWRKYGQKSIKNSPFPRSYYRCSTGKCNAKKQVEKCQEDGGLFLVTYEGIHLHHRPNPLQKLRMLEDLHEDEKGKSPSHICSPSSSTSCSQSIPTISTPSTLMK